MEARRRGRGKVRFTGSIGCTHTLKPGRHELTVFDCTGQRSDPVSLSFGIMR
jgi:hypothetical protein